MLSVKTPHRAHSEPQPAVPRCKLTGPQDTNRTLPKPNMDTKNDGLENVSPFKHGYFGYLC